MQYQPVRPVITEEQLGSLLTKGSAIMCGEYRGHKVEKIEYPDKTTGKIASFLKCEMNIERAGDGTAIPVEIRLPRGLDKPEEISTGLTKGQTVVLRLSSLMEQKGRTFGSVSADADSVMVLG